MRGFTVTGLDGSHDRTHGQFAVFVDRAPMPVGQDVRSLVTADRTCLREPGCPDQKYLAEKGIFLTTESAVTITTLPSVGQGVGDEQHFVNVVLIDGTGHRIGESAWYRPFTSKRRYS
jgi:hypothetical protein